LEAYQGPVVPTYEGATSWLSETGAATPSPATHDLIERALRPEPSPLYVVAIGAATNVASALLLEPEIAERIVVIWLGGNALTWPTAQEFNLQQDLAASHTLLDSGVPLVHVPCLGVADHLITTGAEIERYVRPAGRLGALLADIYADAVPDEPGQSRIIWDLAATSWLLDPTWTTTSFASTPILTSEVTWSQDSKRHLMLEMTTVNRDAVFKDLFARLADQA
jgi:purine nucleosidase